MPEMRSIFAERVAQGFYVNVEVNREAAARYGLTVGDVHRAITSGIGGENIAENIEGREVACVHYPPSRRPSYAEVNGEAVQFGRFDILL
jgi:Cu/Ag efflux pump CusA